MTFTAFPPTDKYRVLHIDDEDVQPAYVCNSCFKEFLQEESKYRHIYNFEVNVPMLEEMRQSMVNTDEMKMWEEKNKQYSENIEQTKQMQEEIRTQLRALIEHKIKKNYASAV